MQFFSTKIIVVNVNRVNEKLNNKFQMLKIVKMDSILLKRYIFVLMNRIVVDVKNMERDACQLKNILNRIRFLGGRYTLSELCEYHNKSLIPIIAKRPDDIIIDCSTSWNDIEKLII